MSDTRVSNRLGKLTNLMTRMGIPAMTGRNNRLVLNGCSVWVGGKWGWGHETIRAEEAIARLERERPGRMPVLIRALHGVPATDNTVIMRLEDWAVLMRAYVEANPDRFVGIED